MASPPSRRGFAKVFFRRISARLLRLGGEHTKGGGSLTGTVLGKLRLNSDAIFILVTSLLAVLVPTSAEA